MQKGCIVAVKCNKYKDRPQIGKVVYVENDRFQIEWMIGTYEDEWEMWWYGKTIAKKKLLRKNFVAVGLKLNSDNKLPAATIAKLKKLHNKF